MRRLIVALLMFASPAWAQWAENRPPAGSAHGLPAQLFPPDNWWNLDISRAPVDPQSAALMGTLSGPISTDWGSVYGIPWTTVGGGHPTFTMAHIFYGSESDNVGYPIPAAAHTEPGWTEKTLQTLDDTLVAGDRHMMMVDFDNNTLYELYQPYHNHTASPVTVGPFTINPGEYYAAQGSVWNLGSNATRTPGWTSADAAGLQVLPGLVTYDEVFVANPAINHAHRFTLNLTTTGWHVWPATHHTASGGTFPLGSRWRLHSNFHHVYMDTRPEASKLVNSFKNYGLILADNGTSGQITGTNDSRWRTVNDDPLEDIIIVFSVTNKQDFDLILFGWGENLEHVATAGDTFVNYRFGASKLPYEQSCAVTLQDSGGTPITTNTLSTGPSKRETSFAGLTPSTSYKIVTDCSGWIPEAGYAFPADSFTTTASTAGGTRTIPLNVKPSSVLSSAARVTVDYGTTISVADGSVQNTSCTNAGGGCTVNLTLPKGVEYWRVRWQDSSNNVLATGLAQALTVK